MKSFLESWLAEALPVLRRELNPELRLSPAAQLPDPGGALCFAVPVTGARQGRFAILADRRGLHAFLVAAGVAEDDTEARWEAEVWQGLVQQTVQGAASALPEVQAETVAEADWRLGVPAAPYELKLGEVMVRLALADETRAGEAAVGAAREATADRAPDRVADRVPDRPPNRPPERGQERIPEADPHGKAMDLLLDVELEASLRFGSREMSLNEVLDLGPGDVVELDRHVSEPVDLLVGDKIVARGEVVLVNGNFGFNVLEVAEAERRLESVRCLF
jgi:flagellar motor switch protein FliN/FliY